MIILYMSSLIMDNISRLELMRREAQFKSVTASDAPSNADAGDNSLKRKRPLLDVDKALEEKKKEIKLQKEFK